MARAPPVVSLRVSARMRRHRQQDWAEWLWEQNGLPSAGVNTGCFTALLSAVTSMRTFPFGNFALMYRPRSSDRTFPREPDRPLLACSVNFMTSCMTPGTATTPRYKPDPQKRRFVGNHLVTPLPQSPSKTHANSESRSGNLTYLNRFFVRY